MASTAGAASAMTTTAAQQATAVGSTIQQASIAVDNNLGSAPSVTSNNEAPASSAAATSNNDNSKRLPKTAAYLPFVYGSIAMYLCKKASEFETHEWTLYVRGPNQEDLSCGISKVVFQLHASFAKPIRELTQPPFEVTERGWGEFEAQIRIVWKDPEEKPTVVNHLIKLYPPGAPPNTLPKDDNIEPVVAEKYDEAVFTDPNETFYRQLGQIAVAPKIDFVHWEHVRNINYSDEEDFMALLEASKFLQSELVKVKERYKMVSNDLQVVDQALIKVSQQQQAAKSKQASRSGGNSNVAGGNSTSGGGVGTSSSNKRSKSSGSQGKKRPSAKKAKTAS